MSVCEHLFDDKRALVESLSRRVAGRLTRAVEVHGEARLFVSGGGTPVALFEALSEMSLPWRQVTVALVDERWVDEDHPASNARLVRTHLLQNHARAARFAPSFRADADIDTAVARMNERGPWSESAPTVAHLGMGGDLHTASIFPGTDHAGPALAANAPAVMRTEPTESPSNPPYPRVTLTRPVLASARLLFLLIEGEDKLARYRQARALKADDAPGAPIVAFMTDPRVTLEVYGSP